MQRGKAICPKSFNQQWSEGLDPIVWVIVYTPKHQATIFPVPEVWDVERKAINILHWSVYIFLDALETTQNVVA